MNVTNQPITCDVVLPHPMDGWLMNLYDARGQNVSLERPIRFDIPFPQQFAPLVVKPGETIALTEDLVSKTDQSSDSKVAGPNLKPPAIYIAADDAAAAAVSGDVPSSIQLVSSGGQYVAIFEIAVIRKDIPGMRLNIESGQVPFTVAGKPFAHEPKADELLNEMRRRDQLLANRTLTVHQIWNEQVTPRALASEYRRNAIRLSGTDPGMPEGLPDDYVQPHRVPYLWSSTSAGPTVKRLDDLEPSVHPDYRPALEARDDHPDPWVYLLPLGIGFADQIKSITSLEVNESGYVLEGLLERESAVIDGRSNSFRLVLDQDLIIRRAELKYHVYDILVTTTGAVVLEGLRKTAVTGELKKFYVRNQGEPLGERLGIAERFVYEVQDPNEPEHAKKQLPEATQTEGATERQTAELEAAAKVLRQIDWTQFFNPTDQVEAAMKLLEQSQDDDAANRLVLSLVNHRYIEGMNATRLIGFRILMGRAEGSTIQFLQAQERIATNELDKARLKELIGSLERRIIRPAQPQPKVDSPKLDSTKTTDSTPAAVVYGESISLASISKPETPGVTEDANAQEKYRASRLAERVSAAVIKRYREREGVQVTPELAETLADSVSRTHPTREQLPEYGEEERFLMSYGMQYASLQDWLVTKSLYEKYGGRVGIGSLGLWLAFDARNRLIREAFDQGDIKIEDPQLTAAFWEAANNSNFADAYPKGEDLKRLLSAPPHVRAIEESGKK